MAEFRYIHTRIWKDNWFSELDTDGKLLFIYLFSNERASVSGIYELPLRYIVFETGLEKDRVLELLDKFKATKKVLYEDGIVWVVNLRKYNESGSPQVQTRLLKDISTIPDSNILRLYCKHHNISYPYHIDTAIGNDERNRDGVETETETNRNRDYSAAAQFGSDDIRCERIYRNITKAITFPADKRGDCIDVIRKTLVEHENSDEKTTEYLRWFFVIWKGCGHATNNPSWLTSWAASGSIPAQQLQKFPLSLVEDLPPTLQKLVRDAQKQKTGGNGVPAVRPATETWT